MLQSNDSCTLHHITAGSSPLHYSVYLLPYMFTQQLKTCISIRKKIPFGDIYIHHLHFLLPWSEWYQFSTLLVYQNVFLTLLLLFWESYLAFLFISLINLYLTWSVYLDRLVLYCIYTRVVPSVFLDIYPPQVCSFEVSTLRSIAIQEKGPVN